MTLLNSKNNIEWLRLLFAVQVMLVHGFHHINDEELFFLSAFPGVPAFFFLSGFLIYASYQKSSSNVNYFKNRFFRLFPGLFFVTLAAFVFLLVEKGWEHVWGHAKTYAVWFFAQVSIGQGYNPSIFRDVGVGVINGALWTITVEILFYICVPLICMIEKKFKHICYVLFVLSFFLYAFGEQLLSFEVVLGKTCFEFLKLTPLVWGWMFVFGILACKHYDFLIANVRTLKYSLVPMLAIVAMGGGGVMFNGHGNELGLVYFVLYALFIFYIAFGLKYLPLGFDLSYGVYVWHMLIINIFLALNIDNLLLVFVVTFACAAISWFFVERPALRLKRYSIRRVDSGRQVVAAGARAE